MLELIARINWHGIGDSVFITLTYPDAIVIAGPEIRANHRQRFFRSIETLMGREIAVLWKTEWQVRKSGTYKGYIVPHYHLMVLDVKFLAHAWVRDTWRAILKHEGVLCTDVRAVTGPQGAGKYMAKYVAKSTSLDNVAYHNSQPLGGRSWGLTRASLVPLCPVEEDSEIIPEMVPFVQSAAEEVRGDYDYELANGFTLLGEARKTKFQEILKRQVDEGERTG